VRRGWVVGCLAAAISLTQMAASPAPTAPTPTASPSANPSAEPTPSSTPSPSTAPSAQPSPSASPSPSPSPRASPSPSESNLLNQVRLTLGSGLANAFAAQTQLSGSLHANVAEQQAVSTRLAATDRKIAALDTEIERLQVEIDSTNLKIEIERSQITALARAIYAQPNSMLLVLAQAHSLGDVLKRGSDLLLAGRKAQDVKVKLGEDLKRLQSDRTKAQLDRDEQERQRHELQNLTNQLLYLQDQALSVSGALQAKMAAINAELAIVGSQSPEVAAALQSRLLSDTTVISAEARRVTWDHIQLLLRAQVKSPGVSAPLPVGGGTAVFIWPIANAVLTQGFGPSYYAFEPPYGGYPHFHTGIDLAAPVNSQVRAAADGVVTLVGWDPWGYGNYVVISHNGGMATVYGHLNVVMVAAGQLVLQWQQIATEGSTGNSTGPHLHFELRLGGVPTDPLPHLPPLVP
jgi:murein DD-endopeptidase MepM/ murein hydrolase activator NlpD